MSLDLESRLALEQDEPAVVEFLAHHGGRVFLQVGEPAVRWLAIRPATDPAQVYVARLTWLRHPHDPPSVTFTTGVGGEAGAVSAWPIIPGYRAPGDICMPFTAEGFGLHPDWRAGPDAWEPTGNPYLRVATQLQDDLDHRYQGRAG
ncbi:MAG: hypothetical protein M3083_00685 [Actinomycetota bacterium]|nr:hypothetical protein [Actinomycetota bacterium]MDQ6945080.1 hypothetical protein [Actinomycetota bacterium]